MATATCKTVSGVYSNALPFKLRTSTAITIAGVELAAGRVAWAGTTSPRKYVNWIPAAQVPVLDSQGRFTTAWYRFFREIADNRLGGIDAPTVGEVVINQEQTQAQVLTVQAQAQDAKTQANAAGAIVNVITQVAAQNNLVGYTQVPTYTPSPNPREVVP